MSEKVTLIPVAMVTPTEECVYAPSRIESPIEVGQEKFISEYADNAKSIPVSFAADGKSDPIPTETYSGDNPMKGRFIIK